MTAAWPPHGRTEAGTTLSPRHFRPLQALVLLERHGRRVGIAEGLSQAARTRDRHTAPLSEDRDARGGVPHEHDPVPRPGRNRDAADAVAVQIARIVPDRLQQLRGEPSPPLEVSFQESLLPRTPARLVRVIGSRDERGHGMTARRMHTHAGTRHVADLHDVRRRDHSFVDRKVAMPRPRGREYSDSGPNASRRTVEC
jgi:hypothetical protein